jgi:hypothetical protein
MCEAGCTFESCVYAIFSMGLQRKCASNVDGKRLFCMAAHAFAMLWLRRKLPRVKRAQRSEVLA